MTSQSLCLVCRDDEVVVTRESPSSKARIQLCLHDQWLLLNYTLMLPDEPPDVSVGPTTSTSSTTTAAEPSLEPPSNLRLSTSPAELQLSWDAPSLPADSEDTVDSYSIICSTSTSNSQQTTSLSLSLTVQETTASISAPNQQPATYTCCITALTEQGLSSLEGCDDVQFSPFVAPTPSTSSSCGIITPVLGVLVGVLFLALLAVCVVLLVLMMARKRKSIMITGKNHQQDTHHEMDDLETKE